MPLPVVIRLNAAIVAVTDEVPRVLTIRPPRDSCGRAPSLPFGPLDLEGDRTLELGLRRWVRERTGLELGYVEQLYTFGDLNRELSEPARILSVTYLALIREQALPRGGEAWWQDWYKLLPWEDHRDGRPEVIDTAILPRLRSWISAAEGQDALQIRRERVAIAFGLEGSAWDAERVLDRYELLWEAGLVDEYYRDQAVITGESVEVDEERLVPGRSLDFDHRRILATATGRIRGKIQYRPVVFELLPETFTLLQLQQVVEALAGVRLHKQNFRRLVERGGLVEPTGRQASTGGRPAALFSFRRDALRERPAPGVGLPGKRG